MAGFGPCLTFTIKLTKSTFFAQIINYLYVNYFWEGFEYAYFFTAYVQKKWVFNQFSVLLTEVSSI